MRVKSTTKFLFDFPLQTMHFQQLHRVSSKVLQHSATQRDKVKDNTAAGGYREDNKFPKKLCSSSNSFFFIHRTDHNICCPSIQTSLQICSETIVCLIQVAGLLYSTSLKTKQFGCSKSNQLNEKDLVYISLHSQKSLSYFAFRSFFHIK